MNKYYHTCPDCGANLDPEEKCDSNKKENKMEEKKDDSRCEN
nr:MAG TPA: DNA-directed RNA polymerase [Caudoviricetes sp.]